jgi:hypothetical protein
MQINGITEILNEEIWNTNLREGIDELNRDTPYLDSHNLRSLEMDLHVRKE